MPHLRPLALLFVLLMAQLACSSTAWSPADKRALEDLQTGLKQLEEVAKIAQELGEEATELAKQREQEVTDEMKNSGSQSPFNRNGVLVSRHQAQRVRRSPQDRAQLKACSAGAGAFAATNGLATAAAPNPFTAIAGAISGLIATICSTIEANM